MNCLNYFNSYMPRDVNVTGIRSSGLGAAFARARLLVIGEMHGVRDNSAVLYALAAELKCNLLGVETWKTWAGPLLEMAQDGSLAEDDLSSLPAAGFMNIESIKTVALLQDVGIDVAFLEDENEVDIEESLSERLRGVPQSRRAIAVLGNWHTDLDVKTGHVSALARLRRARPDVPYLRLRYRNSVLLNSGVGLDYINDARETGGNWSVRSLSEVDYELTIDNSPSILLPVPQSLRAGLPLS